jgi:hypothetical protein
MNAASSPGDVASTGDPGGGGDLAFNKGVLRRLSEGVRNLLVLDGKLVALGKEGDRSRADVRRLKEAIYRLIGKIEEMDERLSERFGELDKRLAKMDKRIAIQVELAVRNELDRRVLASLA